MGETTVSPTPALPIGFRWKEFWLLTGAGAVSVALLIPYMLVMAEPLIARKPLPIPLPAVMAIQVVQSSVLIALFVAAVILAATRCKLGVPLLEAWLAGQTIRSRIPRHLFISMPVSVRRVRRNPGCHCIVMSAEKCDSMADSKPRFQYR
jgi:hypothetical protein